jgi:hypothetical protein
MIDRYKLPDGVCSVGVGGFELVGDADGFVIVPDGVLTGAVLESLGLVRVDESEPESKPKPKGK